MGRPVADLAAIFAARILRRNVEEVPLGVREGVLYPFMGLIGLLALFGVVGVFVASTHGHPHLLATDDDDRIGNASIRRTPDAS